MKTEVRPLWKDILAAIWLGMVIPGIVLHICVQVEGKITQTRQVTPQEKEPVTSQIALLKMEDGSITHLGIDTYLTGVLLAEMPAGFEEEALKAQSVAARTYTMKNCDSAEKHPSGILCDDSGCCQGFLTEDAYLLQGGTRDSIEKVKRIVEDTAPLVLQYDGELIEAVYFSSSGGKTESSLAVWGADYPYLRSVESPGEEGFAYRNRVLRFSAEEFQNRLGVILEGNKESWFTDVIYTEGGGVARMNIGGVVFTGTHLRNSLELPSTAFSMASEGNEIVITSNGYGHRVGMSQYGANAMAKHGYTYAEILAHFYPGTQLISAE